MIVFGVLVVLAIVFSALQARVGIARPTVGARLVVARAVEIERLAKDGTSYDDYADAVRVGLVAFRHFEFKNSADAQVRSSVGLALDWYSAAREAWQTENDGVWVSSGYDDPATWRALHPSLDLSFAGDMSLDPVEFRQGCWERAARALEPAADLTSQ